MNFINQENGEEIVIVKEAVEMAEASTRISKINNFIYFGVSEFL